MSSNERTLLRLGAVSYLNTRPLTYGLEADPRVALSWAVPSRLPGMLEAGQVDVALVPVIDTVRENHRWPIVSDACIGCDGATLTVRVFSRVDPSDVTTLHVDTDSRTSVVLASVIWREKFGRQLTLIPFNAGTIPNRQSKTRNPQSTIPNDCQAVLLIGDKVIQSSSTGMGLETCSTPVDLGATWKSLTGLPFVFAVWAKPADATESRRVRCADHAVDDRTPEMVRTADPTVASETVRPADHTLEIAQTLAAARDAGVARAAEIAVQEGPKRGWPVDLARRYLTDHLSFTLTDRHREGMRRFLELARRHSILAPTGELVFA